MTDAIVNLWGSRIGAIVWENQNGIGVFQYFPEFVNSGIQVSPINMPLSTIPYQFNENRKNSFNGLPGMLADSLPDKFGNQVLKSWLASQGRTKESLDPVERLCYIGKRGMGALEFEPAVFKSDESEIVSVSSLVEVSNMILSSRESLEGKFTNQNDKDELIKILHVGTSAGGARAKAILAWNEETNQFRSGQVSHKDGFEYWIMKFDGVSNNKDKEIADPEGYGLIEYVYSRMAKDAGIEMSECRLYHEGGRSHFMTKRFDRTNDGDKIHMQSFAALAHLDYNMAGSASYELLFLTMRQLALTQKELDQQFLRTIFNIVGRNHDDHVKNFAFLMNREGKWKLSPAFDISYAYNPSGAWTNQHQMTINNKRENFSMDDIFSLGEFAGVKKAKVKKYINQVNQAFSFWPIYAEQEKIDSQTIQSIKSVIRYDLKA